MAAVFANLTKFGQTAAQKAAKFAESVASQSKILSEYEVNAQVGSAGPDGIWKIHRGRLKKAANPGATPKAVSIWLLDKRKLVDPARAVDLKAILGVLEADARQTSRLRHPGIVSVIEPLEDTKTQLIWVTEEVSGSISNWAQGLQQGGEQPSDLEVKHGIVNIAETLHFLHSSCRMAHCNLSPESILVAANGTWKLAGFGFASPVAESEDVWDSSKKRSFAYDYASTLITDRIPRPLMQFTAPELVGSVSDAPVTGKADVFSLACLIYQVLRKQPLLTAETTPEYRGMLASMQLIPVAGLPESLQGLLRSMLAQALHARPAVTAVPQAAFFRDDRLLRALRFIDGILQRDTAQKHAFVRDLPSFYGQFDKRVLRLRVLPCLMHQWQDEAMRDAVLPLVLTMAQDLPADVFQNQVLPELKGILISAQGAQMLEILRAMPQLQQAMRTDQVEDTLVPMLLRGLVQGDTRLQEEVLTAFKGPLAKVSGTCLHKQVLPELLKACLRTKSGAVRCGALRNVAATADRLTEQESSAVVRMLAQITAVDKSPATLQYTLKVAEALGKSKGPEFSARVLLALLSPLLVEHSLPPQLFKDYLSCARDALTRIEQWRLHGGGAQEGAGAAQPTASASWDTPTAAAPNSAAPREAVPAADPASGGLGLPSKGGGGGGVDEWAAMLGAPSAATLRTSASSSQASLQSLGTSAPQPPSGGGAPGRPAAGGGAPMGKQAAPSPLSGAATRPSAAIATVGALSAMHIDPIAISSHGASRAGATTGMKPAAASGAANSDPFADLYMAQPRPTLSKHKAAAAAPQAQPPPPQNGAAQASAPAGDEDWGSWDPFS